MIDRDTMIRDELLAALPHLRRLPDRIDRILTLTSRGELRIRNVVDEDGRRILRTLVNRALLLSIGAVFLLVADAAARRHRAGPDRSPSGTGLFEIFGYGGLLAGTVLLLRVAAAVARDGTTNGDNCELTVRPPRLRARPTAFDAAPPGERYFRHPGDVVRLVLWGARGAARWPSSSRSGRTRPTGSPPTSGAVGARAPTSLRELALALTQVVAGRGAGRRRDRLVVRAALAPARHRSCSPGAAGCGVWIAARRRARSPGPPAPTRSPSGTWVASTRFPSLAYVAGAAAATMVGKPWLARSWRRGDRHRACSCSAW